MTLRMSLRRHTSKRSFQHSTFCGYQRQPLSHLQFFPTCLYSDRVFARTYSYALNGLGLTGKLLCVSLDAASPGCEREAGREAAFCFHGEAEGRAGKSLSTGEVANLDESAWPG